MKKLIPILLAVFAFAACEKDPDMDKMDGKYMVYTNHDAKADFKSHSTYYLPDSILIIGESSTPEYWKSLDAIGILNAYAANMESRGFQRTYIREEADLGIQVSYIKSTYHFTNYGQPEWWWNYPGYWDAPYWGNWGGGWYYPYVVNYSYSTGSYLAEMMNLNATQGQSEKLPVMWTAFMSGILSSSEQTNADLAIQAVNQAFAQSTYISR